MLMPWQFEGASCWGIDTDLFFPDYKAYTPENNLAKRVCKSCVVVNECLTYALHYSVMGIWGGTTMDERNRLRKQLNIIPQTLSTERYTA